MTSNIPFIERSLVTLDNYSDYAPFFCTLTNIINLVAKIALEVFASNTTVRNNFWYSHLQKKSYRRITVLIFLPFIGSLYHFYLKKGKSNESVLLNPNIYDNNNGIPARAAPLARVVAVPAPAPIPPPPLPQHPTASPELYNSNDLNLGLANVIYLGLSAIAADQNQSPNTRWASTISLVALATFQSYMTYQQLPKNSHIIHKIVAHPILAITTQISGFTSKYFAAIGAIRAASIFPTIVSNSLTKILNCSEMITKKPSATCAAALHLFNVGCEVLNLYKILTVFDPRKTGRSYPRSESSGRSRTETKPKAYRTEDSSISRNFNSNEEVTRLANANLNPKNTVDAKGILNLKFLTYASITCKVIKKHYRDLFKIVHPDKNPGNPAAEVAATNLNLAYETVRPIYGCSG